MTNAVGVGHDSILLHWPKLTRASINHRELEYTGIKFGPIMSKYCIMKENEPKWLINQISKLKMRDLLKSLT